MIVNGSGVVAHASWPSNSRTGRGMEARRPAPRVPVLAMRQEVQAMNYEPSTMRRELWPGGDCNNQMNLTHVQGSRLQGVSTLVISPTIVMTRITEEHPS